MRQRERATREDGDLLVRGWERTRSRIAACATTAESGNLGQAQVCTKHEEGVRSEVAASTAIAIASTLNTNQESRSTRNYERTHARTHTCTHARTQARTHVRTHTKAPTSTCERTNAHGNRHTATKSSVHGHHIVCSCPQPQIDPGYGGRHVRTCAGSSGKAIAWCHITVTRQTSSPVAMRR